MARRDSCTDERFPAPSVDEALKDLAPKHPEAAYRRGYVGGWTGAIDAMHELMFGDGLSSQAARDACWNHWRDALFEWYDRSAKDSESDEPGLAYRRGYRDGWAEGTDAMGDLISAKGMKRQAAYDTCRDHQKVELCEWERGDHTKMVPPPKLQRKQA